MVERATDEMYYCPECEEVVPKDAVKCPYCGVEYEAGEEDAGYECEICGSEVASNAKFCPCCGTSFDDDIEGPDELIKQIGDHGTKRKSLREMEQDDDE